MEWANSPIIYREAPEWKQIRYTAMQYFSEKSALCHYYGTANNTLQSYLTGNRIRYKKYFYALRPLLCCRWIERYHDAPPMEFEKLLALFDGAEEDLKETQLSEIWNLLSRKAVTEEKDLNPQMPIIIDFIREECLRQKYLSDQAQDDHKKDYSELNAAFCKLIAGSLNIR
jgi:predicted nucleotidyltransferase